MFRHADVCVLCASGDSPQCCVLHDFQFVNAGRECKERPSVCRYVCLYFLAALVFVCVDVMVMSSA